MAYLLLVMEPRGQREARSRAEGQECYDRMIAFGQDLTDRGILKAANSLSSDLKGARVQVRSGKSSVLDGPYAEAKEMIGGYFLIDVDSREEALALAAECPAAGWASIEVRQIGTCYEDLQ